MQWVNEKNNVKKRSISIGYIVLLAIMIIFFIRAGSVLIAIESGGDWHMYNCLITPCQ